MLRITVHQNPESCTFQLEGRLALDEGGRVVPATHSGRPPPAVRPL